MAWTVIGGITAFSMTFADDSPIRDWNKRQIAFVSIWLGPISWIIAIIGFALYFFCEFFTNVMNGLGKEKKDKNAK